MTAKQVRLQDETQNIMSKYGDGDVNVIIVRMDAMIETYRSMYPTIKKDQ